MSKDTELKVSDVYEVVKSGGFASINFNKRSDGSNRTVVGRVGVRKHLVGPSGKGASYSFRDKNLLSFWITEETRREGGRDNGYRALPCEGIQWVRADKVTYENHDGQLIPVEAV